MRLFIIKEEDGAYRVRKEQTGCSIFTPRQFVEGDDVLFDILETFNDKGVAQGLEDLRARYQAEPGQIEADLLEMAQGFEESCIFPALTRELKALLGGRKPEP